MFLMLSTGVGLEQDGRIRGYGRRFAIHGDLDFTGQKGEDILSFVEV